MAALHGREDALLDPGRFPRFLRQANDAEIADVRKVGEDEYEVTLPAARRARLGAGPPPAPAPEPAAELEPVPEVAAAEPLQAAPSPLPPLAPPPPAPGVRSATLRFRRGSRGAGPVQRPREVPMVGVVSVDEPAPEAGGERPPKPARPPRRRGAGRVRAADQAPAGVIESPAPPAAAAPAPGVEGGGGRRRGRRGKGKPS
jgi:hypothetical protein